MISRKEASLGMSVFLNIPFEDVPKGTKGIIDYVDTDIVMVAWDLPNRPLAENYTRFNPRISPPAKRDRFQDEDLIYLDSSNSANDKNDKPTQFSWE